MAQRKRYDDKFRASAVVMLQAAGYTGDENSKKGSLQQVADALGVQPRVLSRWFTGENNPPPDDVVSEKRQDLRDMLRAEIEAALKALPAAREAASYRDIGTVAAILIDKLQLLEGKATDRIAHEHSGELTIEERASRITSILDAARTRRTGQVAARRTDD